MVNPRDITGERRKKERKSKEVNKLNDLLINQVM